MLLKIETNELLLNYPPSLDAVNDGINMKKIITTAAAMIALSLASPHSFAKDSNVKLNPWQDCGLGAMVFPDNGVAAAISNVIWDLGTTAVTSASASKDNCNATRVQTARFITESLPNLEEDIVKGEGQHLTAMLNLMGCEVAQQSVVRTAIRNDFSSAMSLTTYSKMDVQQKAESLFNVAENAAIGSCTAN
ncbi:MAG: hypothetical protein ACI936_001568 [Paraglaciecola sp.]